MKTFGWWTAAMIVASAPWGCASNDRATVVTTPDKVATRPAADAVIHINGLSCPF